MGFCHSTGVQAVVGESQIYIWQKGIDTACTAVSNMSRSLMYLQCCLSLRAHLSFTQCVPDA